MNTQDLLNAMPIPCVYVDHRGLLAAMNASAQDLFGATVEGRHFGAVFRRPQLLGPIETAIRTGTPQIGRHEQSTGGADTIYVATITPMISPVGVILAFQDTTPLETAEEQRTEFVANVSHELRTPLTALSGFIETLRGPAKDDAAARDHFLEIMDREASRMNRLVDDLLSLARVQDVERMRPDASVDLAQVLTTACTNLAGVAKARGDAKIDLRTDHAPAHLPGDWDQLTQVATNLIENAIKYGREGGTVHVSLEAIETEPLLRGAGYKIAVRDEGEGIEERHLARLTERFYRVDTHRSRDMGGTGLGLAIVKHIVSRHRGRLRIESATGQGSTFTVLLPRT
ncbi:MAG: sensor histidine kinase [Maritimibacter sp.]